MVVFPSFPLFMLPNFSEVIIKRLSGDEIKEYQQNAKLCSIWDVDIKNLKEWLVHELDNWYLVRWA